MGRARTRSGLLKRGLRRREVAGPKRIEMSVFPPRPRPSPPPVFSSAGEIESHTIVALFVYILLHEFASFFQTFSPREKIIGMEKSPQDEDGLGSDLTREHLIKVGGRKDRRSNQLLLGDFVRPMDRPSLVGYLHNGSLPIKPKKKKKNLSSLGRWGKGDFGHTKCVINYKWSKRKKQKNLEKPLEIYMFLQYKTLDD